MYTITHGDESFDIRKVEDLNDVPTDALLATYNELTGKDTKKFASRGKGIAQVWELISEADAAPEVAPAPTKGSGGKRAAKIDPTKKIKIVCEGNPKREGSQAHAMFALYEEGATVEATQAKGVSLGDIRWNLDKGFIELV